MRACDGDVDNAYILIRVFNIDGERTGVKFYSRPWRLYMDGVLEFRAEGGYKVYGNDETLDSEVQELYS